MMELERVGKSDNFNFRGGGGSIIYASLQEALAGNAKKYGIFAQM